MSDSTNAIPMICATSVMKPARARIGSLSRDIALPRTVPIVNLVAAGVGAFLGASLAMAIGHGAGSLPAGLALGGGGGWLAVTYSPLRNESLLKWFELQVKTQTRTRYIAGRRVTLAVGTATVAGPSSGEIRLLRASVRIPVGQYDSRGAIRSRHNHNLTDESADPALLWVGAVPVEGTLTLPLDDPQPTAVRRSRRELRDAPAPERQEAPTGENWEPLTGPTQSLKD